MQQRGAVAVKERQDDQHPVVARSSRYETIESVFAWMFRWVTRTAFGRAVVPDVNISAASVSRSPGPSAGQQGSTARVSASSVRTRCEPNAAYALA